jgi:hypothetical protein
MSMASRPTCPKAKKLEVQLLHSNQGIENSGRQNRNVLSMKHHLIKYQNDSVSSTAKV